MTRNNNDKHAEYKAGLFIIGTLCLLIFSILWVRYFAIKPEITIIAKFSNPGPITKGMNFYYQGVNIGRASKIKFSDDYKSTLVYLDIYNKELHLPSNVGVKIQSEGITGQKYFEMTYPSKPEKSPLQNNQIVKGYSSFGLSDVQDFFEQQLRNGRVERLMKESEKMLQTNTDMMESFTESNRAMSKLIKTNEKNIHKAISNIESTSSGLNTAVKNANEIIGDNQNKQNVQTALKEGSEAAKSINSILKNTNVQSNLEEGMSNFNKAAKNANTSLEKANKILGKTSNTLDNLGNGPQIAKNIIETSNNVNTAAKRIDCVSQGISEMADQRFLFIKLFFGKPGKTLGKCK